MSDQLKAQHLNSFNGDGSQIKSTIHIQTLYIPKPVQKPLSSSFVVAWVCSVHNIFFQLAAFWDLAANENLAIKIT